MFSINCSTLWISIHSVGPLAILIFLGAPLFAQKLPEKYIAYAATDSIYVDGKDTEASWQKANWSGLFIDIEGKMKPKYQTQMKMTWDEEFLYFFAKLEEPHIWGNLKQRDTVIFYNNDFEIFIDPDGDTHNYYEFEMNALNTVWDLFLTRPYRNGTIVLDSWDINGLQTAVHIDGTLNDAADIDRSWSVEIAIPWAVLVEASGSKDIPKNTFWRINFSRVNWDHELVNGHYRRKKDKKGELLPEYNWVWSPQYKINMHMPEYWGYVYFATDPKMRLDDFAIPLDDQIKWHLYQDYNLVRERYAQKEASANILTSKIQLLGQDITPSLIETNTGWYLSAESPFTGRRLIIDQTGHFSSLPSSQ